MPSDHVSVKEAVLPFARFAGADSVLGPEMKSTGEVMGIASDFPTAFGKAQSAAGIALPRDGHRLHHRHRHRQAGGHPARRPLPRPGLPDHRHPRDGAGDLAHGRAGDGRSTRSARARPTSSTTSAAGEVDLVINTPTGSGARSDGYEIRTAAVRQGIPCVTTMTGASAAAGRSSPSASRARSRDRSRSCMTGRAAARRAERASDRGLSGGQPGGRVRRRRAGGCARSSPTARRAATGSSRALDRVGPRARARASSTCSPRPTAGARATGGPTCRARSRSPARGRPATAAAARLPGRGRRARDASGWPRCAPGEGLWVTGPLGRPFSPPAELAPDAAGAILVGGGIGIAPLAIWRRRSSASGASPCAPCSGFAIARTRAGSSSSTARRSGWRARTATAGHRGYVTDLLAVLLEGDDARQRAPSMPAGRRRCWRRCGRSARARASPPSWRWRRRWPAASGPASAARCRLPAAATCGCAWTARWSDAARIETALVPGSGH